MTEAAPEPDRDEKPRGLQPWDSVRASRVQRARELLRDPGYPPRATLDAVADLLAGKLAEHSEKRPGPATPPPIKGSPGPDPKPRS